MKGNKRSISKPREVNSSPGINKSNIIAKQPNKDNQSIVSKNALDLIDKISDERFKNIKSNLDKEIKRTSTKVFTTNVVKKQNSQAECLVINNGFNCLVYPNSNIKNVPIVSSKKSVKAFFPKEVYEKLVMRIQRWFRRLVLKRKKNPQLEMKMLLKKKKMSILRNFNIKSNYETSSDSLKIEKGSILPTYINKDGAKMSSIEDYNTKMSNDVERIKDIESKSSRDKPYDLQTRPMCNLLMNEFLTENSLIKEKEIECGNKQPSDIEIKSKKSLSIDISDKKVRSKENIIIKHENFDFNSNSIAYDLSEMNPNNDVFTPNSKFNLNFNNNSKNIFSPLKNAVTDEDKVNYYNPLISNENSMSINQEIKKEENNHIQKQPKCEDYSQNNQYTNNNMDIISCSVINESCNNQSSSDNKIRSSEPKNKTELLQMTSLNQKELDSPNVSSGKNCSNQKESKFQSDTTNEKFNQILNYLDDTKKFSPKSKALSQIFSNGPYSSSYISQSKKTTAEILNMTLELKEYKNTVATMKSVIEDLKNVSRQKDEYYKDQYHTLQEKMKTDISFTSNSKDAIIENLVSEKRSLANEIDRLNEELSKIELSYNKKISLINENFENERKKDKDAWYVAEKTRRKKWEETRIKEIKEMTIKGLEPEIERILQNHKQEVLKWEENLSDELRKQKERLNKEFEKRLTEQREKNTKEKEEALEHERSLFLQRARNQSERFEDEYSEERRRWNSNLNAEIIKLEVLREKDKKMYDEEIKMNEVKFQKMLDEKDNYYRQKIADHEKRFIEKMTLEIESLNFRANKEKETFVEEKIREFDIKYNSMKSDLMKDKEKQIEIIIHKLGDETISERRKMQVECESKAEETNKLLKFENDQMRNKICELNDKLSGETKVRIMLDENLNILSKRIIDFEHESAKKEKKILELTSNLNEYKNKYSNVAKDFTKEKINIETDSKIKIERHINDMKILSEKYDSLKNYYENKLNEMKQFHDSQINMLDNRVKKKIESKEEIIKKLHDDNECKNITIQKYEEMLSRQRKELLYSN